MKTVIQENFYKQIIKHSKFIGIIKYTENENHTLSIIKEYEKKHNNANHICYAFRLTNGIYRYSDAGEPKNSAGKPIYNILDKNDIYNNIIIVIRYFGGIKLGIGGLVHAYSSTANNLIRHSELHPLIPGICVKIKTKYEYLNNILKLLNDNENIRIKHKEFQEHVIITIACKKEYIKILKNNPAILSISIINKNYFYPI